MVINTLHPASNTGITAMIDTAQLMSFIRLLEARGIEYALVGGAALLTMDDCQRPMDAFDFIIAKADIDQVSVVQLEGNDRNFGRYSYQGTRIDALYRDNPIFEYVMKNCLDSAVIEGKEMVRATPEGIVLLKLYALPSLYQQGRSRRAVTYENDILGLLMQPVEISFERVLRVLAGELLPSQITELRSILEDCQRRAQRRPFS